MFENMSNFEKGVNEMEKEIRVGNESRIDRGKGVTNMSPVVQKDIDTVFAINTGITQYMVSDNAFYRYIHQHYADKSSGRMPYLVDNNVLHADKKHLKCVADNHIKITPYALYEGAAAAGLAIYRNTMQQLSSKVNFNFLIQAYFTYSALCVGISSNGKINLITSNAAIINAIPADDSDKRGAIKRVNPITDDYENGIVQCVELIPKPSG